MNNHRDDKLYSEMRQSLDELDQLFPSVTPDAAYFRNIVQETKEQTKNRRRLDLLAFWCVALAILSVMYVVQKQLPVVFLILQGLSFVAFVLILARKWVRSHDTTA